MAAPEESPAAPLLARDGAHLIGDFGSRCGLSQSARDIGETIRHLGWPCKMLDIPIFPEREAEKQAILRNPPAWPDPVSRLSILSFNADLLPQIAAMLPRRYFEGRYVIGVWFWETEDFPPHHAVGFDYVDEVWVASRHIQLALEKISPVPVRLYPHLIHTPHPATPRSLPAALDHQRFVFLFCYDYRSMAERKNPAGLCEAFILAFPEPTPDGPLCVLKSAGGDGAHQIEFLNLKRRFQHRPDIIFMDGWLSQEERDGLMNRADCYISLHRAEGLGLTLLECMSLGKPCIGTAYSGNLEFMTPENSWLIPFRMIPVGPNRWPFHPDQQWADPDLPAAAAAMREAVSRPDLLSEKGRQARLTVEQNHGLDACAAVLRKLLEDAISRPSRVKPAIDLTGLDAAPKSSRTMAYEALREAKSSQKGIRKKIKATKGLTVPDGIHALLESISETQRLNQSVLQLMLEEMGELKQQTRSYELQSWQHLLADHQRTGLLLQHLIGSLLNPTPPPP